MSADDNRHIVVYDTSFINNSPIRIGLISDTHIPRDADALPPRIWQAFTAVDLILHAGDIYIPEVLDQLETIAPVIAARGNGDWEFPQDARLSTHCVTRIAGHTIGLTHALHYSDNLMHTTPRMIERQFGQPLDIIVVGDTHIATVETCNGVILVNPGSPTVPIGSPDTGSVGMLEIAEAKATVDIIYLR